MKVVVTGGGGFIGSHAAEYYARKDHEVVIFDNLSRADLLGYDKRNVLFNWDYLNRYDNITHIRGDIRDRDSISAACADSDVIIHAAAQTAVTTSITDPRSDFEVNALGTFNVLEAARACKNAPCVVYCSTNKVYGDNVNTLPIRESKHRYDFSDENQTGVPETLQIDLCEHTPYGCSKLTGDLYVQDYAQRKEIDAAVFRMSCIYGTRQFGVEDQGWVAWFSIATMTGQPITIYGDGKQVRDVLYVTDVVEAYNAFITKRDQIHHGVYNIGGGPSKTLSLRELLSILGNITGKQNDITYTGWRPSDQKVYISDTRKAEREIGWKARVSPNDGVRRIVTWIQENIKLFS